MLPSFHGAGLEGGLVEPDSRRLGDLLADKVVVYVDPPRSKASALQAGEMRRWPVLLAVEERRR